VLDAHAAGLLSSLLRRDGPVDRVHIWDCALDCSTADNLKRICDGLQGNRRLRHLNI
jgi:hypothetical protein